MAKFIAFLRGINVGGHNIIKMEALKALFEKMGFSDIKTLLQSGNVVFCTNSGEIPELELRIMKEISLVFGMDVTVIIRSISQLQQIKDANPFSGKSDYVEKLYVTFLSKAPAKQLRNSIINIVFAPDEFLQAEREIYVYCTGGYSNTKLSNLLIEKKLDLKATSRNWKTISKLCDPGI